MPDPAMELVDAIRAELPLHADPDRAPGQQAYMKSTIPFYGITAPDLRRALKPLLKKHVLRDRAAWESAIRTLWDEVTHREEWYAALAIANHRRYRDWSENIDALPLYEHLIRTGAWWDVCDSIAADLVGSVLASNREDATPIMRDWSADPHLWIRRVSILSQLKHKADTDRALLAGCIEHSIDDRDFFARKGIGWALREFSRTDPDWVADFVESHEDRLSALSKKEALRLITPNR
jgi:3-methyladenine DNA glycosylase AlkD